MLTVTQQLFGDPICIYYFTIVLTCLVQHFRNKDLFIFSVLFSIYYETKWKKRHLKYVFIHVKQKLNRSEESQLFQS